MIDSLGGLLRALSGCVIACAVMNTPLVLAEEQGASGQMPTNMEDAVIQENVSGQIARPQSGSEQTNADSANSDLTGASQANQEPSGTQENVEDLSADSTSQAPTAPTLPPAAQADNSIYRCVQNGVPTWQQQPCHQGDAPVTLDESLTVVPARDVEPLDTTPDDSAERLAREKERALAAREESQRQYRIRNAIDDGYLVEGMSEAQAISVLGRPSDVSETISDNTHCRLLNWWEDVRVQFCDDEAISISATQ